MNFAGTYLKSFGHCKVVRWKNSVYTDFDRKELVHNGRVLAAVEVPTIRKIEAAILVRGGSYDDVRQKLENIAAWLYGAGTAKLCHETDLTRYFMARCTQVSTPEYNGHSARATVTFTCADHRLYASYNDQPVETEENNMSNFTFAGKHCLNDMGCLFVKDSEPAVPAVKGHVYEISGMSGTLRYNTGSPILKETILSGTLYFVKDSPDGRMTEAEITQKRHDVSAWLVNAERAAMVMDSDITREYQAEVISESPLTRKDWQNGCMKVKFVVQPVCKSVEAAALMTESTTATADLIQIDVSSLVANGIGYETPLSIRIEHKGGDAISYLNILYGLFDNLALSHDEFCFEEGDAIVINSEDGTIRMEDFSTDGTAMQIENKNAIKYVESGDFPVLYANGENRLAIWIDAAATLSINVECNVRWV